MPQTTPKSKKQAQQFASLTTLRFLLALWVVIYHLSGPGQMLVTADNLHPSVLSKFVSVGYLPVSIFFVLSGFVLAHSYNSVSVWSPQAAKVFFSLRFFRIYPAYFFAMLLMAPVVVSSIDFSALSWRWNVISQGIFSGLLVQAWIPHLALAWNPPGWSLSDEAFFYLCFPFLAPLFRNCSTTKALKLGVVVWLIGLIVPVATVAARSHGFGNINAISTPTVSSLSEFVKYDPALHLADFIIGLLAYRILVQLSKSQVLVSRGYCIYLPGVLALSLVIARAEDISYPLMHNALLLPIYAAILIGLAVGDRFVSGKIVSSLQPLGHASYSLYLLHIPISHYFYWVGRRLLHLPVRSFSVFLLYLAVCIACSLLSFYVLEQPIHRFIKGQVSRRREEKLVIPELATIR